MTTTSLEQIEAAHAKIDGLISATAAESSTEKVVEMKASEALKAIGAELAHPEKLTKERLAYLNSIAADVQKANFDRTSQDGEPTIQIRVVHDDLQVETTTKIIPVTSFTTSEPSGSIFASNMSKNDKVDQIAKLLTDREALKKFLEEHGEKVEKSAATDKMAQIMSMFGLTADDLKDTYEARWKIGDLISLLQNAIKLENLLGSADETTKTAKADSTPWPSDMAGKYDVKKQAYEPERTRWTND